MDQPALYSSIGKKVLQKRIVQFEEFLPSLTWTRDGSISVLDVGCGPGDFTAEELLPRLQKEGVSLIVGVDLENSMISHANEFYAKDGFLKFFPLDITEPNIEETSVWKEAAPFNKIFSYYCLNWVQNHKKAVENIFKLLSDDNGEMILFVVAKNGLPSTYKKLAKNSRWSLYMQDLADYIWPHQDSSDPAGDFRALLEASGFIVDVCRLDDHFHALESEEDAKAIVASINPFLTRIPIEEREEFLQECVEDCYRTNYLGVSNKEDQEDIPGHYIYNRVIVVKARKEKT